MCAVLTWRVWAGEAEERAEKEREERELREKEVRHRESAEEEARTLRLELQTVRSILGGG